MSSARFMCVLHGSAAQSAAPEKRIICKGDQIPRGYMGNIFLTNNVNNN